MSGRMGTVSEVKFRCGCGCEFREPAVRRYRENLDGENGWATFYEELCPECGSDQFEEIYEEDEDDAV